MSRFLLTRALPTGENNPNFVQRRRRIEIRSSTFCVCVVVGFSPFSRITNNETKNAGLVLSIMLVSVIAAAQAAEKTGPSKTPQSAFQVKVSNGNLSLEADDASLRKVFEEIGNQAGIMVEGNLGPAETVTMRLDKVPLEEAIKRLSDNVTIVYGEKPNERGHRIRKIVVLSEDKRKVTRSQDAKVVKSSKAAEPEPRPEPFKFDFDPTKAMKK